MRYRNSTGAVVLTGLISVALAFFALWQYYNDGTHCTMSYSRAVYQELPFRSESSLVGSKYRLFLYREGGVSLHYDHPDRLGGTPVLFLPGNAGSYSQGRSIAAQAAVVAHERGDLDVNFDFFLVHFDEDMSAMHGKTLLDQAAYVNDAIAHILDLYASSTTSRPQPSSVIIISHSMGGIVARTLVTLPNYAQGSVNTIVTLSTPHMVPPLTFDRDVTAVYDFVNLHWRTQKDDDMALISIAGGHGDRMVMPDYTAVDSLVPPTNGFRTISYGIPGVWRGIDHLAIVWCAELRDTLLNALIEIVDISRPSRTVPIRRRMAVFRKNFLSAIDGSWVGRSLKFSGSNNKEGYVGEQTPLGTIAMATNIEAERSRLANLSMWQLLSGAHVPLKATFTDITVPAHSSLFALNVRLENASETVGLRHWYPGDSRWYKGEHNTVIWYSNGPYIPYQNDSAPPQRLHLQVVAPDRGSAAAARIRINWTATLANVAMHYRTLMAVYPAAIVCICLLLQIRYRLPSFEASFELFTRQYLLMLCAAVMVLHILLGSSFVENMLRALQMPSESRNMAALRSRGFEIHDMLVGTTEPLLAWIPVLFIIVSTAAVHIVDCAARLIVAANRMVPEVRLSERMDLKWTAAFAAGAAAIILLLVPYQVVFVAIAAFQLLRLRETRGLAYTHALLLLWTSVIDAPILAIWVRNLNWRWTIAFSTPRNLFSAAPTVALVAVIGQAPIEQARFQWFTQAVLAYTAIYALLFGPLHTFMLHNLVNYLSLWLLVSLFDYSSETGAKLRIPQKRA